MNYPIKITNEGKTVEPLNKKTKTVDFTITKAEYDAAATLLEHSGISPGVLVKIKMASGAVSTPRKVIAIKQYGSSYLYYYPINKVPENLCIVLVEALHGQPSVNSASELEIC